MATTPAVLLTLALAGYLVSMLGAAAGLQTAVALGQMLSLTCVAMLALWAYSRYRSLTMVLLHVCATSVITLYV
jgi:hypothetical protein